MMVAKNKTRENPSEIRSRAIAGISQRGLEKKVSPSRNGNERMTPVTIEAEKAVNKYEGWILFSMTILLFYHCGKR
ncbi:hypothetical protein FWH09_01820 [Candidatus Saccharibacteria bacterium]|nr:hypothetical protein [Candidatus Saccharibacteria bacterium]